MSSIEPLIVLPTVTCVLHAKSNIVKIENKIITYSFIYKKYARGMPMIVASIVPTPTYSLV